MRQSQLFTKTVKEDPKDEKSTNARLLIRAGFVDKLMSGVYSYLPLGLLTLKKIENIIREEMNNIGGQEVLMPALSPKSAWEATGRFNNEVMFKLKDRLDSQMGLGWTHEEIITPLVKKNVNSYKDLPIFAYQIQNKFRSELRAKSGLLRGIEFIMKDLYSFHADEKDLDAFYEKAKKAYFKIFKRCGIGKETILTYASGGEFSEFSHEFQTITESGEDEIYFCKKCKVAVNKEIIEKEKFQCPQCASKDLEIKKAIETGNIFKLQDRFSKPLGLVFKDKDGSEKNVLMGCYGIGLGRLMGAIVEVFNDENGIIWPKEVAPFDVHLIRLEGGAKVKKEADKIYEFLQKEKINVLYDDREEKRAGEKFADSDLIGLPYRLIVSEKTLLKDSVELKERSKKASELVKIKSLLKVLR